MKLLFRFLLIVALAVGLGIFAQGNAGYVQIAMPSQFSLEWSLNLFLLALLALFVLFYLLLRGVSTVGKLPKRWRQREERKLRMRQLVQQNDMLLALWREDYAGAQKNAEALLAAPETSTAAALVGACAALRNGDSVGAERFLQQPSLATPEHRVSRALIEAEQLLRQRRYDEMLVLLSALDNGGADQTTKRDLPPAALWLKLRALAAQRRTTEALSVLEALQQAKGLNEDEAFFWRSGLQASEQQERRL